MLQCSKISKYYSGDPLFEDVTFALSSGERLGLVGRNGCGKSTIFRLVTGEETPDEGTISIPKNYRVGHLEQHLHFEQENIVQEVCLGLPEDERMMEYKAEILLSGLGFSESDMLLPASRFSGGYQIRINLARLLVSTPDLLLLDEPTNYLDIISMRWLTRFLQEWKGELIIISHDREFLDAVTTHTMLIHRGGVRKIRGGTQKLYDEIAVQEEVYEKTRVNEDKKRKEVEQFINRFRAQASKAALVQSRMKALERMGTKEELTTEASLDFVFTEAPEFHAKYLIEAKDITFGYDNPEGDYNVLIENLSLAIAPGQVIGVIGKNGKGKSTLLKLLAEELTPRSGTVQKHTNCALGYFGQTNISRLVANRTIEEEISISNPKLSRTQNRAICGTMLFSGDDALKKIGVLSGGEKSRVLLGKLLAQPTNLLLLDEPTNHLDMESIEALVSSIKGYRGSVVIVTHSEYILRSLATQLVVFQGDAPFIVQGDYEYFLSSIGWEEEEELRPSKNTKKSKPSTSASNEPAAKNDKRTRAERINERSRLLKPLELESTRLEAQITQLDATVAKLQKELVALSSQQDGKKIAEASRALAYSQKEVEELFGKLEKVTQDIEGIKKQFADLL
jgi:ATP-binding cassette subfamily F protein 3